MTLLQIACAHCANWQRDSSCLGAWIEDDGSIRRCSPKSKCVLGPPGVRCAYFEECVMPMGRTIEDPVYRQQFEQVIRDYRRSCNLSSQPIRKCQVCGRTVPPRVRFCHICKTAKRRASFRAATQKRRHMSTVKPLSTVDNQALAGAVFSAVAKTAPPP